MTPDGRGLPDEARAIVEDTGAPVHLRLTSLDRRTAAGACGDAGLGGWWTGKASEVTCPACLEVVHA